MDYPLSSNVFPPNYIEQFPLSSQNHGHITTDGHFPDGYTQQLPLSHDQDGYLPIQAVQPHSNNPTEPKISFPFNTTPMAPVVQSHQIPVSGEINDVPVQPMAPPPRPRKRKAPTLREDEWAPFKDRIIELHIKQGLPLPKVKKIVEDVFKSSGFTATLVP